MCVPGHDAESIQKLYARLDEADQRMVRELILRLHRKAHGLKRKVIYEEDCG